jgi:hypothetical protein
MISAPVRPRIVSLAAVPVIVRTSVEEVVVVPRAKVLRQRQRQRVVGRIDLVDARPGQCPDLRCR